MNRSFGLDRIYLAGLGVALIVLCLELAIVFGFAAWNGGRLARWSTAMRLVNWALPVWAACTAVYAAAHFWARCLLPDSRSFAFGLAPIGLPVAATFAFADLSRPFDIAFFFFAALPLGYLVLGPPVLAAALWTRHHLARAPRNMAVGDPT